MYYLFKNFSHADHFLILGHSGAPGIASVSLDFLEKYILTLGTVHMVIKV